MIFILGDATKMTTAVAMAEVDIMVAATVTAGRQVLMDDAAGQGHDLIHKRMLKTEGIVEFLVS